MSAREDLVEFVREHGWTCRDNLDMRLDAVAAEVRATTLREAADVVAENLAETPEYGQYVAELLRRMAAPVVPVTKPLSPEREAHIRAECTKPGPWRYSQVHIAALLAEVERLRKQVRVTRNSTLRERAADIVSYCPDHGTRDTMRDTCRCEVASEILLACEAVAE